jgi:hypothetical protein
MTVPIIKRGDPMQAEPLGLMGKAINRYGGIGPSVPASTGTQGPSFHSFPEFWQALFELTSSVTMPDLSLTSSSHINLEPTPYATGKQVWCEQFKSTDVDNGNEIRSYGGAVASAPKKIYFPWSFYNDDGYAIGHPPAANGDRVPCMFNRQSGRWESLAPPLMRRRFELNVSHDPGGSATEALLVVDGVADTDAMFAVNDPLSMYRGRAKDAYGSPHNQGSRGESEYMPDTGTWDIRQFQMHALMIRGDLTGDLSASDDDFEISSVVVMSPVGAIITDTDPAGNVTIQNRRFDGDSSEEVVAAWDEPSEKWIALDVMCPSLCDDRTPCEEE